LIDRVPSRASRILREAYLRNVARNTRCLGELRVVADALESAGIPTVVLKGAFLAGEVYGNIGLRVFSDLDLMVPRDKLRNAADTLTALGYAQNHVSDGETVADVHHHIPPFLKEDHAPIEVHWAISPPSGGSHADPGELWKRAVPATAERMGMSGLCPEDLLLHLCAHLSHQHRFAVGLSHVCDIAQVLQRYGAVLNWEHALDRAERWGWQRGVFLTLRLAEEMLGAQAPQAVLEALRTRCGEAPEFEARSQIVADRFLWTSVPRGLALAWRAGGCRHWAPLALRKAFVSKQELAAQYSLPADSRLLYPYYLVRWTHLIAKYGGTGWWWRFRANHELSESVARTEVLETWLADAEM
jgi:hypothetical protein